MALLGCDVVATDQVEVLPLLMRNIERNTSRILQMNPASGVLFNLETIFIALCILQFQYMSFSPPPFYPLLHGSAKFYVKLSY